MVKAKCKEKLQGEFDLLLCLACGEAGCQHESGGPASLGDKGMEFDPFGGAMKAACRKRRLLPFPKMRMAVQTMADGILRSRDFWTNCKFVGGKDEDLHLKAWARARLFKPGLVDSPNWISLRYAIKEALRHKRQRCIDRIAKAFHGELS